jgi:hypothetical protein
MNGMQTNKVNAHVLGRVLLIACMLATSCSKPKESTPKERDWLKLSMNVDFHAKIEDWSYSEAEWITLLKNTSPKKIKYVFEIDSEYSADMVYDLLLKIASCGIPEFDLCMARENNLRVTLATIDSGHFEEKDRMSDEESNIILTAPSGTTIITKDGSIPISKICLEDSSEESMAMIRLDSIHKGETVYLFVDGKVAAKSLMIFIKRLESKTSKPPVFVIKGKERDYGWSP